MSTDRAALLTFTLLIVATALPAQRGTDRPRPRIAGYSEQSALRARVVIEAAVQAMGGVNALRRIATVTRELSGNRTDIGQGGTLVEFSPIHDAIGRVPPTVNRSATTTIRDLKGQRAAEHVRYDIYGGQHVSRRSVLGAADGFNAYFDYVWNGIRVLQHAQLAHARIAAMRRHPESLLLAAWDRPEAARWAGDTRWERKAHNAVAFADADGTQLTLYFDAATHLLSKVETLGEDGVLGDVAIEVAYDDYRVVRDVKLPYHYIDRRGGVVQDDQRVTSIVLDAPLSDTLFARPSGLEEVDFGKPFPYVEKLGDDVYAVLGGYNTIFVVFDAYVAVLEAGGSSREAESVIARIKETAPGKPIRYVVSTHWNFDHLSGIRPYVAEGATIIAPPSARPVIERSVASQRPLHPDALSRQPRMPVFEALGGKERRLSDGHHQIVVYDISPSPHVNEMYIAYLPKEKVLLEADLLDIVVPGHVG